METIICDITAFEYWRIPPVVHLLLAGDEDGYSLLRGLNPEKLMAARVQAVTELPLCRTFLAANPHTRHMGSLARELRPVVPLLAANYQGPVDVLVRAGAECHTSALVRPRIWSSEMPLGTIRRISEDVDVVSPACSLLQITGHGASITRTIMLASELCGTFAVYNPPPLVRNLLQSTLDTSGIPIVDGWRPFITSNGKISSLWSRPPLATPDELIGLAEEIDSRPGCRKLITAAKLVAPNAASPFEVRTGMLLGLPRAKGGMGFAGLVHNKKIRLTKEAALLAQRKHCYCDLYWPEGFDLECQSALVHQNEKSYLSDSDREAALACMGINVLPVTYDQIRDAQRFGALSNTIARMRGIILREKTERQCIAERQLRDELFVPWNSIQAV